MDIKSCNVVDDNKKMLAMVSLGDRFRKARESMGLSQQKVADDLCLKLSIIKSIEENCVDMLKITSTFLYGYIRSYARLLQIDHEEAILSFIHEFNPIISVDIRMKSTSKMVIFCKKYKSIMIKSLIVIFSIIVFIFLIFVLNRSRNLFFKKESSNIFSIVSKYPVVCEKDNKDLLSFFDKSLLSTDCIFFSYNYFIDFFNSHLSYYLYNRSQVINVESLKMWKYSSYKNTSFHIYNNFDWINYIGENVLVLSFTSDCWIKILDAKDKILYMGTQYSGNILTLRGEIPYRLIVGAPQSVSIRYKGNIVDLREFTCPDKVARLIIPNS